jgi:hypothetical protein
VSTRSRSRGGVYIVDGDTPVADEAGLRAIYEDIYEKNLAINVASGAVDSWDGDQLNLTYCVSRAFGEFYANLYEVTVNAMNAAATAWEGAANVRFVHVASEDGNCTAQNRNVLFDVRPSESVQYRARAFFPSAARARRNVLVTVEAFDASGPITLEGILRHELGHVLGFRHEHTRPEVGTCFENNSWKPLTEYDRDSVMHYPRCNGNRQSDYSLSPLDVEGVQRTYGPPGGPGNPGPGNPGPGNPGPGNPGPGNPGPGNPDPGNPGPGNPGQCQEETCAELGMGEGACEELSPGVAIECIAGCVEWVTGCN